MKRRNMFAVVVLLLSLQTVSYAFTFKFVDVAADTTVINKVTFYTFSVNRMEDSVGYATPFSTPVPAGSNITVKFPPVYNTSYGYNCLVDNVIYSCSNVGQLIVITGYFTTDIAVSTMTIVINNVLNPSPASLTAEFIVTMGDDSSDVSTNNFAAVQLQSDNFTSCSITFSPNVLNRTNIAMTIRASPQNPIPSTGSIVITYPSTNKWFYDLANQAFPTSSATCTNGSTNVNQLVSCVSGTNSNGSSTITATSLFNTANSQEFAIQINGQLSPPTTSPRDQFIITSVQNGDPIDVCVTSVSGLQPNTMTVSITSANTTSIIVNRPVTLRFSFTAADTTNQLDTYSIVFPTGSRLTTPTIAGQVLGVSASLSGTTITFSQNTGTNRVFFQNSAVFFTMTGFTAPQSTQETGTIQLTILRDGFSKMVGTTTIQAVMSTLTFNVTPSSLTVNQNTSYLFSITISDGILSSGRVKIDFPSTITQAWTSSSCATVTGTNMTTTPTCTLAEGSTSLLLTNLNLSSSNINSQTFTVRVSGIINPPSTQPSGNFNITTYYSSTDDTSVASGSMGAVTATVSTLNSSTVTITPSSSVVRATGVSYTVSFQNNNPIPTNGYIILGIPDGITAQIGSVANMCFASTSASSTPSSTTCSGVQSGSMYLVTFPNIFSSSGVPANSTITLRIDSIFTNPVSTEPVSSFSISTYTSGNFLVDQLSIGLSVKMTTPADFTTATVTAASKLNSEITNYTINLAQPSSFDTNSKLAVTFPAQIVPQSTATCSDLASASLSCTVNGQVVTINLGSTASNTGFGVIVNSVKNAPSLKPSSKFGFSTITSSGLGEFSRNMSTVSVTNTRPSAFKSISASFSPQVLKSPITANIIFSPTSDITGYIIVSLASSFTLSSLSCTSVAFTGSCLASSNLMNVTGSFAKQSMTLTISGLSSPSSIPNDYTVFTTYDSSNYIIDQSTDNILFTLNCTLPCRTCSTSATTCTSCYNDTTITQSVYYNILTNKCVVTCDSGYYADTTQLQCLACQAICATCSLADTNCTSCNSTSSFPYLNKTTTSGTCLANCDSGMYPDTNQSPTLCVACVSPCATCTTQTSCLSCVSGRFLYLTGCVTSCPVNVSVGNEGTNTCDPCASVCATCSILASNCTSCASTAALYNGNCVSSCPDGLVVKNGNCVSCDSPCNTCIGTSTNCTSCISTTATPHLFGNTCVVSCPSKYYNDSAVGNCLECTSANINCALCSSKTTCIACDTGFVFLNSSCLGVVPPGYVNISGFAELCTGDCATCSVVQSNCTSCKTLLLSNYQCIATCPNHTAPVLRVCTTCSSPCLTCSELVTNCTSCLPTLSPAMYLSGNQCINTCPSYTYANASSFQCTPCVDPCMICESRSSCLSCITGFNLYEKSCLQTCPAGFTAVASVCVACTSPCLTCSTSASTCTACLSNLSPHLFLTETFCVQASKCPDTTYANLTNNKCTSCIAPCNTCTSASACLSCITGFNLEGTLCKSNCLDGFTPVNSICTACTSPCATCAGTTTSCLSCQQSSPALFLSGYFCLPTCPEGTYANSSTFTCASCASPCATCTSSAACVSCVSGNYLYQTTCSTTCPLGYVGVIATCQKCNTGCRACQTSTTYCISCLSNYYLLASANECLQTCPTGLFADPTTGTCIGCTAPCSTCSGSTTNCTSCLNGNLYQGTCLTHCPSATYQFNSQCQACQSGCSACTSATDCQSCFSGQYLYNNGCVSTCPSSAAVIVNSACTACSTDHCTSCTSGDFCVMCNSPYVLHVGSCLTSCPTNFTSNGTNCVDSALKNATDQLTNELSSSRMFPMPFSIAGLVVIMFCLVSKFQNSNTFASGAIYSLLGLLEWGALGVFGFLYFESLQWKFDLFMWIIIGAMGVIYLLNFITFILLLSVYRADSKFQIWLARACSSRGSFAAAILISLFMCHKYCNILFTRLFGFNSFKAQLESVRKFYSLHVISLLSMFHSLPAIGVASYISYNNTSSTTLSQLFLSGIDVIVITVINLIMTGANSQKDQNFFVEKEGDLSLNKKILDNDQYLVDAVDPDGVMSQKGQAYIKKIKSKDQLHDLYNSDSQNSINVMLEQGAESEGNEIIVQQSIGDDCANPAAMVGATPLSRQSRSRVSKSKSSAKPPLPPHQKAKTQPQYNEELQHCNIDVDNNSQSGSEKKLKIADENGQNNTQKEPTINRQKQPTVKSRADISIQAYEMLSNDGSYQTIQPPPEPEAVGVETSFQNIFDIPKVDRSVQGSKTSKADRSEQFSVKGKDKSVQLSEESKNASVRDQSMQNSNHNQRDQSMQYQPSMLSEVSKKHTLRDQSVQGTIPQPSLKDKSVQGGSPERSFKDKSIQGSISPPYGKDKSVQGTIQNQKQAAVQRTIGYNEASIQNTINHQADQSAQGTIRGKDVSIQGTIHKAENKSIQGAVSIREQSIQLDPEFRTIPVSDSVSVKSFGIQHNIKGEDKSMQEGRSMHDQSDQYDQVVEVVNKSLQNSQVGSEKSVQNDPLLKDDKSVQMSQKQYVDAPTQQKPVVVERSVQQSPPPEPKINYKSIEQSISANDTRQHQAQPSQSDVHVLERESRMLQTQDLSSVSERNQKEIQLERMLRERQQELGRIRKEVQLKERESLMRKSMEKEKEEKQAKLRAEASGQTSNFKKKPAGTMEMRLSNNFMKNPDGQEPLGLSKTLKREERIENPLLGISQTVGKPGSQSQKQEDPVPASMTKSRIPAPYQNTDNVNTLGSTVKPGQQLPVYRLDDASNPLERSKLPSQSNEQEQNPQNRSSSKTIEEMKEMLNELDKDRMSKKSIDRTANNFTFNKDQIEVGSKLSEEDLQHMRSLKSEMSNSKHDIDVIEEVKDEHLSEAQNSDHRQNTRKTEQQEASAQNRPNQQPRVVDFQRMEQEAARQRANQQEEEQQQQLQTSNQQKTGAKTKKTKGQDTSKQMFTNRYNNNANTDDSGMGRPGTGGILMKDILSEPENKRLKFKNRLELGTPQIQEKQIDLNLSEDEEQISHKSLSRGATQVNPVRLKGNERQSRPKGKFQYEETNGEHEDRQKGVFSVDNNDIEKSVRESEDELYKQPISFFPQGKNYIERRSEDSDLMPGFNAQRPGPAPSEKTIEQYRPTMTPQPMTNKAKPSRKIPKDQQRQGRNMVGPIMLTAGGHSPGRGDSGDKRLNKPSNLKKSPLKDEARRGEQNRNGPQILMSDTELSDSGYDPIDRTIQNRSNALTQQSRQESDRIPNKKQKLPPKKYDLMYETSEEVGENSLQFGGVGISPTEFNQYNQRYEQQRNSPHRPGGPRNDMPLKPQIITRTVSRELDARKSRPELSPVDRDQEIHRRIPMMINTLGIQQQDNDPIPSRGRSNEKRMRSTMNAVAPVGGMGEFEGEELRDYYGTKGLRPKELKVDKDLEKIYLQRQYYPKKSGQKTAGRSTSRDKL